jgi:hypothetical protein
MRDDSETARKRGPRGISLGWGIWLLCLLSAFPAATDAGAVELRDHGPIVAFGYARKSGEDLFFPSLGWRWRWGVGAAVDRVMARIGTDLSWYVEPMAAPVVGGQETVELQIVPGLRFEPRHAWFGGARPYLEGGIGLMYTGLDDIGLGSNILFSDNVGLGLSLSESGWSFGYRYRHSSHAGLWAETNSGLDVHYLTIRYDLRPASALPPPGQSGTTSTTSSP